MILDFATQVAIDQSFVTTGFSTSAIDLGIGRNIGDGGQLHMHFHITTSMTGGTSAQFSVVLADDAVGTGFKVVGQSEAFPPASLSAGTHVYVAIDKATFGQVTIGGAPGTGKRFLLAAWTTVGVPTGSTVTANIVLDAQATPVLSGSNYTMPVYAGGFKVI